MMYLADIVIPPKAYEAVAFGAAEPVIVMSTLVFAAVLISSYCLMRRAS